MRRQPAGILSAAALLPVALVAGCIPRGHPPAAPVASAPSGSASATPLDGACHVGRTRLLDRVADAPTIAFAQREAHAATVRVIRPGMAVTMDYRGDRLNIVVDRNGRIVRAHCG